MNTLACPAMHRTPWRVLRVQMGDPSLPTTVTGPVRLAALHQWRQGKTSPGVWVTADSPAPTRPSPEDIDWVLFPTAQVEREITANEARCAQYLPRRQGP